MKLLVVTDSIPDVHNENLDKQPNTSAYDINMLQNRIQSKYAAINFIFQISKRSDHWNATKVKLQKHTE